MIHPYNDAERFEEIAQVYTGGYEWEIAAVWRDKLDGHLYGDTDAGCSCYGPFETEPGGLGDLKPIEHVRDAAALLDDVYDNAPSTTERQDFVRAVDLALAAKI